MEGAMTDDARGSHGAADSRTVVLTTLAGALGLIVGAVALGYLVAMTLSVGIDAVRVGGSVGCLAVVVIGWRAVRGDTRRRSATDERASDQKSLASAGRGRRVLPWIIATMVAMSALAGAGVAEMIALQQTFTGVVLLVGAIVLTMPMLLLAALASNVVASPARKTNPSRSK
jgi:small neutral amino acid transporter SnatA (MarC family)